MSSCGVVSSGQSTTHGCVIKQRVGELWRMVLSTNIYSLTMKHEHAIQQGRNISNTLHSIVSYAAADLTKLVYSAHAVIMTMLIAMKVALLTLVRSQGSRQPSEHITPHCVHAKAN